MIRFKCSQCGARMEVDETYVGHPGRCPTCGASITVPAASTVSSPSGGMAGAGMRQGRTAGTTIRVHGEEVSVRAPLETTAIASIVLMGLSVVLFIGIWLSGNWAPALGVGALLAMLMAILSVLVAVTAYHNVRRSRGLRRGMGAAYAGLIGGASLFLIFLIVTAWSFVVHANRPSCEENLRAIWTALGEYADSHDEKFPPTLAALAHDTSLRASRARNTASARETRRINTSPSSTDGTSQKTSPSCLTAGPGRTRTARSAYS